MSFHFGVLETGKCLDFKENNTVKCTLLFLSLFTKYSLIQNKAASSCKLCGLSLYHGVMMLTQSNFVGSCKCVNMQIHFLNVQRQEKEITEVVSARG